MPLISTSIKLILVLWLTHKKLTIIQIINKYTFYYYSYYHHRLCQ